MENKISIKDLYISFFKIGLFTFGGGLAMIPMLEKEIVEKRHWCSEEEILNYYAVGQCTPGIIAVNTATFVGYKHRGIIGGIVTTLGVISPSLIIITIIASFIKNFASLTIIQNALKGLGAGVCAIIIPSIIKMFNNSIKSIFLFILAALSFISVEFFKVPVYLIVIFGIIAGLLYGKVRSNKNDLS